jgi:tetratricopeptide (TPR) repeat protein/tRNA A-37 threonylcarbamoyl transferase component Bud32
MGEVYLAEDTRLRRKVALKRLSSERLEAKVAREWLLHEARAAATLTHRNIAAIFDIVESNDEAWIVMEYVPGETLSARARREYLPVPQVIDIGIQLADGLSAAHGVGVIHRDLKPSNVRLTSDGTVKILDFGIARLSPSDVDPDAATVDTDSKDRAAAFITPQYAAPEQLQGRPASERSDVYSLGVLLFELLTGRRPYESGDPVSVALSTLTRPVAGQKEISRDCAEQIVTVIRKAIAGDPEARFQSAAALKTALEDIDVAGKRLTGRSGPAPDTVRPPWRTRTVVVISALAVAMASGTWFLRNRASRNEREQTQSVVVLPLANLSGDPAKDYLGVGVADTLTSDLAKLNAITVVSRAMAAGSVSSRDLNRIARDLGVNYIVDGGVQQNDGRLKLTARLVRPDGSVAWGGTYEGTVTDLFSLQNELASALSEALEVRLTAAERNRLGQQPTTNIAAFTDYAQGLGLLERVDRVGNVERAIELLSSAVEKDRTFALAHAALGEAYWARYQQTNDPEWTAKARAATLEALRLDSEQAAVRHSLAVIYRGSGELDKAIEELHRALALRSNADDVHQTLGEVLADKGQLDEAIPEFRQAIALRPNFWGHYDALGLALYRAGRFPEAAAAFEMVIKLQPDNAVGFQRLGTAYHAAGDTAKALTNYQRALELSPTPKAYANLGFLYYREGRFAEAATAYEQALRLDPSSHLTHHNVGDVYNRLGRRKDAEDAYGRALEITNRLLDVNPRDSLTLSNRALYEAKLGRNAAAERDAAAAVGLSPKNGQVLYNNAVVNAISGRREAALKALEEALALGASSSVARDDDDLRSIRGTPEFERVTTAKR